MKKFVMLNEFAPPPNTNCLMLGWGDICYGLTNDLSEVTYKIIASLSPLIAPTYPHIEINITHVISLETKKNNMNKLVHVR